jgi:hypothetical protein
MKDIQTQLEKLRGEAAECLVLSNLSTDPEKQNLFARVADHITGLASAVQNELAAEPANAVHTVEKPPVVDRKPSIRFRQMLPWIAVAILLTAAGGFFSYRAGKDAPSVTALEANAEPPQASQEDIKQTITNFLLTEQEKQKALSEQLEALVARVNNLEQARAELPETGTKRDEPVIRRPEPVRQHRQRGHRSVDYFGVPRY